LERVQRNRHERIDYAFKNDDLSAWNVSNATQMGSMFAGALVFNGNIFSWEDVSPVTNMSCWMFQYANTFNQDLSTWTVSKVTNIEEMFQDASSFHQNLSLWNVSNVQGGMRDMFGDVTTRFDQDVDSWELWNSSKFLASHT
jgi:hypothetical protein